MKNKNKNEFRGRIIEKRRREAHVSEGARDAH